MAWMHDGPIGQSQVELPQGVKALSRELLRLGATEEIGSPGGADKQRVPGEHAARRVPMVLARHQMRDVFRRVAGRAPNPNVSPS